MNKKIVQFHSGTAVGDAITNQMFFLKKILERNGYESEIYAEYIDEKLSKEIRDINEYQGDKDNIIIIHHSMGMNAFEKIVNLPDRKILIYHNITPEEFFDDEGTKKAIRLGIKQVSEYKKYVDYVIADSNYNRRQLLEYGYSCDIDVLPVHVDLNRLFVKEYNSEIVNRYSNFKNIIFVGRLVWNKCQTDIVKAFAVYNKYFNAESRLLLVGSDSMSGYVEEICDLSEKLGIAESVIITGKVEEEELASYYSISDVFLSMSEHEGYGVPLLEAMKMKIPVLAYKSSAISETLGGGGILFTEKNYEMVGALINEVVENGELRSSLVEHQTRVINKLSDIDIETLLMRAISNVELGNRKRRIQLQGPFESSYSLAIVNRKLIEQIDSMGDFDTSIYCTEGPGDYIPQEKDLEGKENAKRLWKKSSSVYKPDVVIRNMYPPRVHDTNGALNFQLFGWEESIVPKKYIDDFNRYLDGIGTMSDYVTEKLVECGLNIPVKTMGVGVELPNYFNEVGEYRLKTKKNIRFLHISSAFPRKGIDLLIEGYFKSFSSQDSVCLVIKTFPNPHNNVAELLDRFEKEYPNHPEIEWINEDLPERDLYSLYKACDCYVQVARGEGFGLPVAEAMLAKMPVIVSPNSGLADFCNKDTALLVDYRLTPAKTHLTSGDKSMWFEPEIDSLVEQFDRFMSETQEERMDRVEKAYSIINNEFSWDSVAKRWISFISEVESEKSKPNVAMVTTWNTKCGIAEYTKMEVNSSSHKVNYEIYPNRADNLLFEDEAIVKGRFWDCGIPGDIGTLSERLVSSKCDIVNIQYNYGFFSLSQLGLLIDSLYTEKKVVLTLHKTDDAYICEKRTSLKEITDKLNLCSLIIVHQEIDKERLIDYGVNPILIAIVPLGQIVNGDVDISFAKKLAKIPPERFTIGSYGFFLPHKGIDEVIKSLPILKRDFPNILYMPVCSLYDAEESKEYYNYCVSLAKELGVLENVRFEKEYLSNEESLKLLSACDVLTIPYKPTGESASGSVRVCLAANRPTIVTDLPIFKEFEECTYQIKESEPTLIASAIKTVCNNQISRQLVEKTKKKVWDSSWPKISKAMWGLYMSLVD